MVTFKYVLEYLTKMESYKIGGLFAGQGFQKVGMLRDLYKSHESVRKTFSMAVPVLDYYLDKLCFEGKIERNGMDQRCDLNETRYTQPAVMTADVACFEALKKEIGPLEFSLMAGHSLGQYAALVCSEAVHFQFGLSLVNNRAKYSSEISGTGMLAILSTKPIDETKVCEAVKSFGLELSLVNHPRQYIVAGNWEKIEAFKEHAKLDGVRYFGVPVSVAFHTSRMRPAAEKLAVDLQAYVQQERFKQAKVPVVANTDAQLISTPEEIADECYRQMTETVRWDKVMQKMYAEGINLMIAFGLGTTEKNKVHNLKLFSDELCKSGKKPEVLWVEDLASLEKTVKSLKELGY